MFVININLSSTLTLALNVSLTLATLVLPLLPLQLLLFILLRLDLVLVSLGFLHAAVTTSDWSPSRLASAKAVAAQDWYYACIVFLVGSAPRLN